MPLTTDSPAFGQADLSNCERELIHLAGSVQPHGLLLVLDDAQERVRQYSANAASQLLGSADETLLGLRLSSLQGNLQQQVQAATATLAGDAPVTVQCHTDQNGRPLHWEGTLHRNAGGLLILELEPRPLPEITTVTHTASQLLALVAGAVQRFSNAASISVLTDAAAQCFRDLIGHDRVMVYKFDADGHGKIVAEARDPRLDSLLGHHYPATDIPQRARELYLRNRVRVLVDVHYQPSLVIPQHQPSLVIPQHQPSLVIPQHQPSLVIPQHQPSLVNAQTAPLPVVAPTAGGNSELDMSMCYLRSMSPLHLQYLKNMGVTATVVVSLVREGRLWGLIAAHHYSPRNICRAVRAACDLLAEVVSTRIAAIENYAHAQVAVMVRLLEQRLIEATSTEGDWRMALFRNPGTLLQPLEATGAVLFVDGEILTTGEVPSTPELRELLRWVDSQAVDSLFSCASVGKAHAELDSLTPTASGVLAVKLSATRPDYLMWLRREQLHSVTWAGDPSKPMVANNPLELSPRSSFAAWSEIVRGTALPWTTAELAMGRAIGVALVDIIVQVHAVRLLIAQHQLTHVRATVLSSSEPVMIADAQGRQVTCNEAFALLTGCQGGAELSLADAVQCFEQPARMRQVLDNLRPDQPPWRGELSLARDGGPGLPVSVRAELVTARGGTPLGTIVTLFDLRDTKRAAEARRHLEASIQLASRAQALLQVAGEAPSGTDHVISAILTNASLAAMDIADGAVGTPVAQLLEELEASTQRATALYSQMRELAEPRRH